MNTFLSFNYIERARRYSNRRLIIEFTLLAFALKIVLTVPWIIWIDTSANPKLVTEMNDPGDPLLFVAVACLAGPIIETLVGQWLPIRIAQIWSRSRWVWIGVSILFFSSLHLFAGFIGVLTTAGPAFFFALCFVLKREVSRWQAVWVTTVVHALHNGIALSFYFLEQAL